MLTIIQKRVCNILNFWQASTHGVTQPKARGLFRRCVMSYAGGLTITICSLFWRLCHNASPWISRVTCLIRRLCTVKSRYPALWACSPVLFSSANRPGMALVAVAVVIVAGVVNLKILSFVGAKPRMMTQQVGHIIYRFPAHSLFGSPCIVV